jgi:hypothetical protein
MEDRTMTQTSNCTPLEMLLVETPALSALRLLSQDDATAQKYHGIGDPVIISATQKAVELESFNKRGWFPKSVLALCDAGAYMRPTIVCKTWFIASNNLWAWPNGTY